MSRLLVGTMTVASLLITASVGIPSKGWSDLFQPPYDDCPSVMMSIGCLSKASCYIPGGMNDVGYGVYNFNGQENGNFSKVNMPYPASIMAAIAVGGEPGAPFGVVGGVGFGDGLQYFANATTIMPSVQQPFMVVTLDIRMTQDGSKVLVADQGPIDTTQVIWSTNGGKNFSIININSNMPSGLSSPRYCSMANDTTWFVTIGNWPEGSRNKNELRFSRHTSFVRDEKSGGGAWKRVTRDFVSNPYPTGYSCVIAKTLDAGKTWYNVMYEAKNYFPNGIDCISPTHCIAVGEGEGPEKAGAHIWLSEDGETFLGALHLKDNSTFQYSLTTVRFLNHKEAWVGGSYATPSSMGGLFFSTNDGGYTWTQHSDLLFVGEVSGISFTPDGYGFATALTQFDTSTVLKYSPTGPPATPVPTWNGNYSQKQCSDLNCSVNCSIFSYPQYQCSPNGNNGSYMARCYFGVLEELIYPFTTNCTGLNEMNPMPIDQCIQGSEGGSFVNYCGPPPSDEAGETFD